MSPRDTTAREAGYCRGHEGAPLGDQASRTAGRVRVPRRGSGRRACRLEPSGRPSGRGRRGQELACWTTWPSAPQGGGGHRGRFRVGDGARVQRPAPAVRADAAIVSIGCPPRSGRAGDGVRARGRPVARPVPGRSRDAHLVRRCRRTSSRSLCLVDDAQWLDDASAQIALVRRPPAARRADRARVRRPDGSRATSPSTGFPSLAVTGLGDSDARALLLENLPVRWTRRSASSSSPRATATRSRCSSCRARGPRRARRRLWFSRPAIRSPTRSSESYAKRLQRLPPTRSCSSCAAAAEPLGDPVLLHRAAEASASTWLRRARGGRRPARAWARRVRASPRPLRRLPLGDGRRPAAGPPRARRCHRRRARSRPPCMASRAARPRRRRRRRRRARALRRPRSGSRRSGGGRRVPRTRGGAVPDPAGAHGGARGRGGEHPGRRASTRPHRLLAAATDGRSTSTSALAHRLKGQIALDLRRGAEAAPLLLDAARRLEASSPTSRARPTSRPCGRGHHRPLRRVTCFAVRRRPARRAPPSPGSAGAADLLLDGLAIRFTDGYAASAQRSSSALRVSATRTGDRRPRRPLALVRPRSRIDLFDDESARRCPCQRAAGPRPRRARRAPALRSTTSRRAHLRRPPSTPRPVRRRVRRITDATGEGRIRLAGLPLAGFAVTSRAVSRGSRIGRLRRGHCTRRRCVLTRRRARPRPSLQRPRPV